MVFTEVTSQNLTKDRGRIDPPDVDRRPLIAVHNSVLESGRDSVHDVVPPPEEFIADRTIPRRWATKITQRIRKHLFTADHAAAVWRYRVWVTHTVVEDLDDLTKGSPRFVVQHGDEVILSALPGIKRAIHEDRVLDQRVEVDRTPWHVALDEP